VRKLGGALAILVMSGGAAAAAPTRARIVVLEGMDLPPHMASFHSKVEQGLEAVAREQGREVVAATAGTRWCNSADCFRATSAASGAAEVIAVGGGRNEYEGYRLEVELRRSNGELMDKETGGCNLCSGPEMVTAAETLARQLLVRAPVPMGEVVATAPTVVAAPTVPAPAATTSSPWLGRGAVVAGGGLAAVLAGAYLWHLDGESTGCESNGVGGIACPSRFSTARLGIPLTIVGALGVVAGTLLVVHDVRAAHTGLAVGPGSLALVGSF
jgi:hypothetical protein